MAVILATLCLKAAAQVTWYVDAASNGINPIGTQQNPFIQIQDAINAAASGDTVLVLPGVYVEQIDYLGKMLVVASTQGPGVTFIDGNQTLSNLVSLNSGEPPGTRLSGFTIRNSGGWGVGGIDCNASSIAVENCIVESLATITWVLSQNMFTGANASVSIELTDCIFRNNNGRAMYAWVGGSGNMISIRRCEFSGNGVGAWVEAFGGTAVIDRCVYRNNSCGGLKVSGNVTIANSRFCDNNGAPAAGCAFSFGLSVSAGDQWLARVVNCSCVGNADGLTLGYITTGTNNLPIEVVNTIVYGNQMDPGGYGISTWSNCIVQGPGPWPPGLRVDPLFVDVANGDLRLRPGSPARDSGTPDPDMGALDFAGNPRVWGAGVDIGADEFALDCMLGTVGVAQGQPAPAPVVAVNGVTDVFTSQNHWQPMTLTVAQPPTMSAPAAFALWLAAGDPPMLPATPLPWGVLCLPPSFLAAASFPGGAVLATPAPWSLTLSAGLPFPIVFTVQGVIQQSTATTNNFAVTNAITVEAM